MKRALDILDLENKEYEYKLKLESNSDSLEKWAKTLVGFANTYGGYILVGVSDEGFILGITRKEVDQTKNLVLRTINRYIFPHIQVKFSVFPCENEKYVLSIWTDSLDELVIFKAGDFNEKVYLREDGSTIPATISQILSIGKRKSNMDSQLLSQKYKSKEFSKFIHLAVIYRKDETKPTEKMLISNDILSPDGRMTEGLRMFSDAYDSDETLSVCRLWNGYNKGSDEVIDKKEFSGCLCMVLWE